MSEARPKIDPYPMSSYNSWAWERNRDPILQALKTVFPKNGEALELASGSGAHINYFAPHFPDLHFQPSDCDLTVFAAIEANRVRSGNANVAAPVAIDLTKPETWPGGNQLYDVIFAINCFHVAPPAALDGFAQIAARVLKPGGAAAVYGPFKVNGRYTSPSNEAFDKKIEELMPGWGLKDVRDLEAAANKCNMAFEKQLEMPANNLTLIFSKPEENQ